MRIPAFSSKTVFEAPRLPLMKAQALLAEAQREVVSGRRADVGASLGFRAGQSVSMRSDHGRLGAILDTNALAAARMEATQSVLESLAKDAQSFLGALIGARNSEHGAEVLAAEARARLGSLVDGIGTAVDGVHVFAGVNSDSAPLARYFDDPPPPSRQSVAGAFFAAFAMPQSDAGVFGITAADMQTFLDGGFAALTAEPSWSADWSQASSQNLTGRISLTEKIETSVNANASPIRKLVSAYVMVADLGAERLNQGTFQSIADTAVRTIGAAVQELAILRANLGTAEERIATANARMSVQIDVLASHVDRLESVDPYEASTRVASLLTQIETAYALTARIQQMSLLDYL
ncbi:MAG: flagellar hook-associated family protein [Hyphomicrobiaceae bacterium]|nr:flagellar hook-associated family protein [Hyphomicrobiaceae bacterium]